MKIFSLRVVFDNVERKLVFQGRDDRHAVRRAGELATDLTLRSGSLDECVDIMVSTMREHGFTALAA
jgi:hypothetical protein